MLQPGTGWLTNWQDTIPTSFVLGASHQSTARFLQQRLDLP